MTASPLPAVLGVIPAPGLRLDRLAYRSHVLEVVAVLLSSANRQKMARSLVLACATNPGGG